MISQFNQYLLDMQEKQRSQNNSCYELEIMKLTLKSKNKIFQSAVIFPILKMIQETLEYLQELSKLQLQMQTTGNLYLFTKFHKLIQETIIEASQLLNKLEKQLVSIDSSKIDIEIEEEELAKQVKLMKSETFSFLQTTLQATQRHLLIFDHNLSNNEQFYIQIQQKYNGNVLVQCYSDPKQLPQIYLSFIDLPTVVVLNHVDIQDQSISYYLQEMSTFSNDFCCLNYINTELERNQQQSEQEKKEEELRDQLVQEKHRKSQQIITKNVQYKINLFFKTPPKIKNLMMIDCFKQSNLLNTIDKLLYQKEPYQFILYDDLKLCLPNYRMSNYYQAQNHASFKTFNLSKEYGNEEWIKKLLNLIQEKRLQLEIDFNSLNFFFTQLDQLFSSSSSPQLEEQDIMAKILQLWWNPKNIKIMSVMKFLNSSLCCLDNELYKLLNEIYQIFIYAFYLYDDSRFALQQIDGSPLYLYKQMTVTQEELEEFLFQVGKSIVLPSFNQFYAELKDAELQLTPKSNSNDNQQNIIICHKYLKSFSQSKQYHPKSTYYFTQKNIYQMAPFSSFEITSVQETKKGYYIINTIEKT